MLPGDEAGLRGGEEGHQLRHVGGLAQAVSLSALSDDMLTMRPPDSCSSMIGAALP